ncbi:MAG: hypothetical protein LBP25_05235 [Tannerellaceae bacterium]|jgi:hypothetical protein|nr:hypothetical protein [Tannerellaceae bacterium]
MKVEYKSLSGLLILCLLILLTACFSHEEQLVYNYYFVAVDGDEDMTLSYKLESGDYVEVVPPTVFSAGYNDDFIIAKLHPMYDWSVNRMLTVYYIIPLKFKVHPSPDENRIGPLSEEEFESKKIELNIPDDLRFTKVFKKLE